MGVIRAQSLIDQIGRRSRLVQAPVGRQRAFVCVWRMGGEFLEMRNSYAIHPHQRTIRIGISILYFFLSRVHS